MTGREKREVRGSKRENAKRGGERERKRKEEGTGDVPDHFKMKTETEAEIPLTISNHYN